MKLFTILENEFKLSVDQKAIAMEKHSYSCLLRFSPCSFEKGSYKKEVAHSLPGKDVINNILSYAKALEVLHHPSGKPLFLIGN